MAGARRDPWGEESWPPQSQEDGCRARLWGDSGGQLGQWREEGDG